MSVGMILLYVLGFLAVVIVCSLGFIARLRERAVERKRAEQQRLRTHQPPKSIDGPPGQ